MRSKYFGIEMEIFNTNRVGESVLYTDSMYQEYFTPQLG